MVNFNGFVESGALTGPSPIQFYVTENSVLESRLAELDPETQREVRKHLGEFHSADEMERFINQSTKGGKE